MINDRANPRIKARQLHQRGLVATVRPVDAMWCPFPNIFSTSPNCEH